MLQLFMKSLAFLIAEYEYLSQNAFQSNEDRVRVFNYYLAAVGTIIASGLVFDLDSNKENAILGYIFIALGFLGIISILTLIRLRAAWKDSVLAMNQIKAYIIDHSEKNVSDAFKWNATTLPSLTKINSVGFLTLLTISIVSSIAFSIGITLVLQTQYENVALALSLLCGVIVFTFEVSLWFLLQASPQGGSK